jgi:hypothetical protein
MNQEQAFQISMKRISNAINHVNNNQKRMKVAVAPPMDDRWGFLFTPVNGGEPVALLAEYDKSRDAILWKSTNSKITKAFMGKVQKYVNTMIALSLGKTDEWFNSGVPYVNMKEINKA